MPTIAAGFVPHLICFNCFAPVPTALFISPHLDDVAFSCTRLLGFMAATGWRCVVATVFTQSVPCPQGFALACQTSKGLPATVDYMQLRREEDARFVKTLNRGLKPQYAIETHHGDLPEAPHRGYHSPDMLFNGPLDSDKISFAVRSVVDAWIDDVQPVTVVLPSGYGSHIDHSKVLEATEWLSLNHSVIRYRDTPYVIRHPHADPPLSTEGMKRFQVMEETEEWFSAVGLDAIACYQTQLLFQYGGEQAMRKVMAVQSEWYWVH